MHRRTFLSLILLLTLYAYPLKFSGLPLVRNGKAFSNLEFLGAEADYKFGQTLSFRLVVQSEKPVTNGTVTFKEVAGATTGLVPVSIDQQDTDLFLLSAAIDLVNFPLRAFSEVQYRFDANLEDGDVIQSPEFSFFYLDNRFEWQSLDNGLLRVHWNGKQASLGEKVLETAQKGLKRSLELLDEPSSTAIDIYVYDQLDDMRRILPANLPEWSVGHAEPDLNLVMVALPEGPEQEFYIQQHIPHEIMHIIAARLAGNGDANLPAWLREGLASNAELYPDPDFAVFLENARQKNYLLPMGALCNSFPQDSSNAFLAYAQSASFVRYLFNRFESRGVRNLIDAYSSGEDCTGGLQVAVGESLHQVESQWLSEAVGQSDLVVATNNISPWFFLLISIFIAPVLALVVSLRRRKKQDER